MALSLALVLHAHQPVDNFDHVIEAAYQTSYRPFIEVLAARPWLRFSLHYTGFLLDWLGRHHPEYIQRVGELAAASRVEILGGGYYEPILPVIAAADQREQLHRLSARVAEMFGVDPRGMWLAERVWSPELPRVIEQAGLEYTLLDDSHFQLAGVEADDLHGFWLSESQGHAIRVAPSNFFLRQAIPFRPESEALDYLSQAAAAHPGTLLTMGDDLEKFGSWPHTFEHVYPGGWLARFLDGLEALQPSVVTVPLGEYMAAHPPRGLIYLPTASYPEMMRWALPFKAAMRLGSSEAASGTWPGFLTKYREANWLHKSQLDLSRRIPTAGGAAGATGEAAVAEVRTHLLAAQCNDVFWHGWFGGLYSPHLRNVAYTHLLAADRVLRQLSPATGSRVADFDFDGRDEIELRNQDVRIVASADGGCLEEIDFLPADANLVNSLQRRPELYHDDIRRQVVANPANLPGEAQSAGRDLESLLIYDRYPRTCGRLYRFTPDKEFEDFRQLRLGEDEDLAGGEYEIRPMGDGALAMGRNGVEKRVELDSHGFRLACTLPDEIAQGSQFLLEMVFNLLAAAAPDRYLRQESRDFPLDWAGRLPPQPLWIYDGWRDIAIRLSAPDAAGWWLAPIYTVSQSDTGFESIYQGTAIGAIWAPGARHLAVHVAIGRRKNFL